jgi:hypothetical protein
MAKKRKPPKRSMLKPQRFCLFCGGSRLSKTHIWPNWLNSLLSLPGARTEKIENELWIYKPPILKKQGSLFSLKPRLCCVSCNTGWMEGFERDVLAFPISLFTDPNTSFTLSTAQQTALARWVSLITILAEFVDPEIGVSIPRSDRQYLMNQKLPPLDTWTISVATLRGLDWRAKYRHHALHLAAYSDIVAIPGTRATVAKNNTQIPSFGMGNVFFQTFVCPNAGIVSDYRASLRRTGLLQIWPIPNYWFWPFKKRAAVFPTKAPLNDEQAETIADSFQERLKYLTQPDLRAQWERRL